jgi:hypothetical protein
MVKMKNMNKLVGTSLLLFPLAICYACQSADTASVQGPITRTPISDQGVAGADGLMIVDCLLPGQIRKIGRMVYQSRRRPGKMTVSECEIRGGEYVAYDRANYQTALTVWKAQASAGDKVAQTYVGEIYEKGLGIAPDYDRAAQWYRKAAKQGYNRAQINLGHLYELGLGVPKDMAAAIGWYRKGAGLSETLAIQGFIPDASTSETVQILTDEIERLQQQIREAEEKLRMSSNRQDEAGQLQERIISLETQLNDFRTKTVKARRAKIPQLPSMDKGDYFALIVGNNRYADREHFPELATPAHDAQQLKRILVSKYRFNESSIEMLIDATHEQIFVAMASFNKRLGLNDKFLIYYAGHGVYDEVNSRGYWLPVDARKENRAKWISNAQVTDYLNEIQSQHILVIADSCYSGTMTDLAILHPRPGMSEEVLRQMVQNLVEKRSRTVLTSGGLTPVFDTGGGKHSVFAEILLQVLDDNKGILAGKDLFNEVSPRVSFKIQRLFGKKQEPDYGALNLAGHAAGDFFFVPQTTIAGVAPNPGQGRF